MTVKKLLFASAFLFAVTALVLCFLPLKSFSFEGNSFYSDEELRSIILDGKGENALLFRLRERMTPHKEIPFIQKYKVSFNGLRNVRIRVYEKSMAGFLRFQEYFLYFDYDGTVLETSNVQLPGLYEINGLRIGYAVVGERLPVEDPAVFRTILTITQFLDNELLQWEGHLRPMSAVAGRISFGSSGISVNFGDVNVLLGSDEALEQKLALMSDILPELSGMSGTLYLDSYKEGETRPSYVFR